MKNAIVIILLFALQTGCKTDPTSVAKTAIEPYVKSKLSLGDKIDVLTIYKMDTATALDQLKYEAQFLDHETDKFLPVHQINTQALERTKNFYVQSNGDAHFAERVKEAQAVYDKYFNENLLPIVNRLEVLSEKGKTADSTKFLAYDAKAVLKYTTATNVQKTDSVAVLLSKDFKVIERKDFWENKF